jgi:cbb3-type cytochrome oxidase subunit 3
LGYLTQISLIGSGFVVSWMFVLGLIFLGLWIMALRIGRRTDELKASKKAS